MQYSDYFTFPPFYFSSCLDRKLQVMCLDQSSSRLQNQRTGLPLVQLLEVSHGWAKEYSSSLFFLLYIFPFPTSPSLWKTFPSLPWNPFSNQCHDYKMAVEEIIWSTVVLEFMSNWSLLVVFLLNLSPKQFQKNQVNNEIASRNAFWLKLYVVVSCIQNMILRKKMHLSTEIYMWKMIVAIKHHKCKITVFM